MSRKKFYALIAVLCLICTALGCGSSSDLGSDVQTNQDASMVDIWDDETSAQEILDRLGNEGLVSILGIKTETVGYNEEGVLEMQYTPLDNSDEEPAIPYSSETMREHYEAENVIVLDEPDLELVNKVRIDLGLEAEDSNIIGESGKLDIYALALKKNDGIENIFTYVVPYRGDLLNSGDDNSDPAFTEASDVTEESQDDTDKTDSTKKTTEESEYSIWDFQIDRWVRFLQWLGNMNNLVEENFTDSFGVRT